MGQMLLVWAHLAKVARAGAGQFVLATSIYKLISMQGKILIKKKINRRLCFIKKIKNNDLFF